MTTNDQTNHATGAAQIHSGLKWLTKDKILYRLRVFVLDSMDHVLSQANLGPVDQFFLVNNDQFGQIENTPYASINAIEYF